MKLLRIIGILVLMLLFWQNGTNALAAETDGIDTFVVEETYISAPQHSHYPDAELGVIAAASVHSFAQVRTLRTGSSHTFLSLKALVDRLAQRRAAMHSYADEKLADALLGHNCHFACEYYIFSLRRILI